MFVLAHPQVRIPQRLVAGEEIKAGHAQLAPIGGQRFLDDAQQPCLFRRMFQKIKLFVRTVSPMGLQGK
jgi:hypothetical protein